ncbi:radical SAM family protein [Geothermobacter ehrlichii]|uniref:Radical SAM family protein n=1 Tax=Geothermobacter ehrlichii TaxID=213224 RepID=A0A5D3WP58_9BACT|nr:radical SAM protein [Geothermobacter ehrlichii]TYP00124.1 radical SAM family protein [Geothermobacter ehrlichii]
MKIYPFFIPGQGCPSRCVYCRQELFAGAGAPPSPAEVAATLERWLPRRGEGEIAYFGGSFSLLPPERQQAYLEVAAAFVDAGRCSGIRISTHPLGLGAETLRLLRRFRVTTVEVGCQSFDDEVLRQARRGHDAATAIDGLSRLGRSGFRVGVQLMPGLPGGSSAEALDSLRTALDLPVDFFRFYPTVVLPGTPLAQRWRQGEYRPWDLDEAVDCCARMYLLCLRAGVPVIRMGVPPLDLSPLAGPWHPAFGQLVKSRLWYHVLAAVLPRHAERQVAVSPDELSDAQGHGRSNLSALERRCGLWRLVTDAAVPAGRFRIGSRIYNLADVETDWS